MSSTKFPVQTVNFEKARPVWIFGRESEMNLRLSFRAIAQGANNTVLRLSGSSAYNVKVNGEFISFGPARCAHAFYRVDELDLSGYIKAKSVITVDVTGYNADSFYHIDQPAFLCAELIEDGKITAATGEKGFICRVATEYEQKAERYAFQRTFCETYNLTPIIQKWEKETELSPRDFSLAEVHPVSDEKTFIPRGCEYNVYDRIHAKKIVSYIDFEIGKHKNSILYPAYIIPRDVSSVPCFKHFTLDEVQTDIFIEARNIDITSLRMTDEDMSEKAIEECSAITYKMEYNTTGRIEIDAESEDDAEILVTFDEFLSEDGSLNFRRMYTVNAAMWRITGGKFTLSTFEPYTMSAIRVHVLKGKVKISDVRLVYFGASATEKHYTGNDVSIQKIFDAAVETYRQNTFTIFMDCPSRERAGWLCDSFFTARVEKILTGKSVVEHNFLENFMLPDSFTALPEGMFAECYPADQYNGNFITNWAMWLVIELEEYLSRTGDRRFIDDAKIRVYALLDYLLKFENNDGLLE
ncbi:MAG: hypothetical protein ACI4QR_01725, partial [Eubacteriales bacterium]